MKADALVRLLREMADMVDSGADILLSAAEQIGRDQATLQSARAEADRLMYLLAEPTR